MAKKKNTKSKSKQTASLKDKKILPQNIVFLGERVEENKNIYILQKTYKEIHKFTQNKTTDESGGMLVGYVMEEFGKTNIVINGFIEAKHCEATPTTLKFTHETWDSVHKEMDKKYPDSKIVGWIHTHPNFGIFLSEYDKFIHESFFGEDHQIAYVVDPIQNQEGFYFWINGKIERCKGFYVYDKTGAKISVNSKDPSSEKLLPETENILSFKNVLIGIMAIVIAFLIVSNISLKNKVDMLDNDVVSLKSEVKELKDQVDYVKINITDQNMQIPYSFYMPAENKDEQGGENAEDKTAEENSEEDGEKGENNDG